MIKIKLMAEYGGTVIWHYGSNALGPIDPETLPLSKELRGRLSKWASVYDKQINMDDPKDVFNTPGLTPEEERWFEEEGGSLWLALRKELGPEYHVAYFKR